MYVSLCNIGQQCCSPVLLMLGLSLCPIGCGDRSTSALGQ